MAKKIFISYRRADAQMAAGRLHDALVRHFGALRVFRDKEGIRPGYDWTEEIQRVLHDDVVVLLLVGPQWAGARDAQGRRRLDDPGDPNRIEIETALTKKLPVVPVLVDGADVPGPGDLPASLEPLARRHAIRLRDDDWDADFTRLARATEALGVTREEMPAVTATRASAAGDYSRWMAAAAAALVVVVLAWLVYSPGRSRDGESTAGGTTVQSPPTAQPGTSGPRSDGVPTVPPRADPAPPAQSPPPQRPRSTTTAAERLAGEWGVTQYNTDGSTHQGTLSLAATGQVLHGTLSWQGLPPASIVASQVTRDRVVITVRYPDGLEGRYEAGVSADGTELIDGHTAGGGSTAKWRGARRGKS